MAVPAPSLHQLSDINKQFNLNLDDSQIEEYRGLMGGLLQSLDRVDQLVPEQLTSNVPRAPGKRPAEEENKLNAWYWKTNIVESTSGKLLGKKIALKDNICLGGSPMMNGSRVLEGYVAEEDATVVTRLLKEGATIIGKAACEDLCLSGGSLTSALGAIKNPYDTTKQAGGSSGGSAVVVATGEADIALACDQGGSIRIPSCWCGVVGHKPTWGLVPYTGIFSMEPTIDHCGPVAKTVKDCALALEVLAGKDGLDYRTDGAPDGTFEYVSSLTDDLTGLKVGILKEGFGHPNSQKEVDQSIRDAAKLLEKAGASVKEVSVPMHLDGGHIWTAIGVQGIQRTQYEFGGQPSGAKGHYYTSMADATFKGMKTNIHRLSKTNILFFLLGEHLSKVYGPKFYLKGHNLGQQLTAAYDKALEDVDVLVMPTLPMVATPIPKAEEGSAVYVQRALEMIPNTTQFDVTGHPAITIPTELIDGLPAGMMIVGKKWDDATVLKCAHAYEAKRGEFPSPPNTN